MLKIIIFMFTEHDSTVLVY